MKIFVIGLNAGQTLQMDVVGTYYRVLKASAPLSVATDNGDLQNIAQGIGEHTQDAFTRLYVYSASAQTVEIAVSFGRIDDARLSLSAPVDIASATAITTAADVALAATATSLIKAATAGRKEIIISNLGSNTVRVGDINAGAARGQPLEPAQSLTLNTSAAVYAYNPGAGTNAVSVIELS